MWGSATEFLEEPMSRFRTLLVVGILCGFTAHVTAYTRHPEVSQKVWDSLMPYFLPEDHPARKSLDRIFKKSRVTLSAKSMGKAGFTNPKPRKWTHLIVTTHPKLKGYVIKAYVDAQRHHKNKPEYHFWMLRIKGVRKIQKYIGDKGWGDLFATPKKWIYPLPVNPTPPSGFHPKRFVLIEEDMNILSDKDNCEKWRSAFVDEEVLDKVYAILQELGLRDCAKPDNIPFTKNDKIAFVDTQTFEQWPISYPKLASDLSPSMRSYWKDITKPRKR